MGASVCVCVLIAHDYVQRLTKRPKRMERSERVRENYNIFLELYPGRQLPLCLLIFFHIFFVRVVFSCRSIIHNLP